MEKIIVQIKRRKTEFIQLLLIILAGFIIGMGLGIIISTYTNENSSITLGSFFATLIVALMQIFGNIFSFLQEFNLAIGMGQTRKRFVWCYELVSLIQLALFTGILYIFHLIEKGTYALLFPSIKLEVTLDFIFQWKYVIPAVIGLVVIEMFAQALLLRYGMKAFWGLWAAWMIMCLAPTNLLQNDITAAWVKQVFAPFIDGSMVFKMEFLAGAGVIVGLVLVIVAWNMLRKQRVTA